MSQPAAGSIRQRDNPHAVALPAGERAEVIRFARSLEAEEMLGAGELTKLAECLAATAAVAEAQVLRDSIETGFYGRR